MRLFLAYDFENDFLLKIEKISSLLKEEFKENPNFGKSLKINFVDPSLMHITLKFLEDENPEKIINSLIKSLDNFSLNNQDFFLSGLDAFPNKKQPKVIVLPVLDEKKIIENKFNEIEKILDNIGIKKEQRSFKPHLTIARVKYADFNCFNNFKYWSKLIGFEENKLIFKLNKLKLYQSILTPQKPIYKVIHEF